MAMTMTIATAPMMIGVLLEAVDEAAGTGGGIGWVAWDDAAATDDVAVCATEAATGTGSACGGLGGAGRGGEVIVAVEEDTDAGDAVPTDAGTGAGLNSTPQCTQNLAVGWFSLSQAAHFIDPSSKGISGSGLQGASPHARRLFGIRYGWFRGAHYYGPIVDALPARAQVRSSRPRG
jgi:hypothetical protein